MPRYEDRISEGKKTQTAFIEFRFESDYLEALKNQKDGFIIRNHRAYYENIEDHNKKKFDVFMTYIDRIDTYNNIDENMNIIGFIILNESKKFAIKEYAKIVYIHAIKHKLNIYSKLCYMLKNNVIFKSQILKYCQNDFECNNYLSETNIGNIKFICELYQFNIIDENIINICIEHLKNNNDNNRMNILNSYINK